MALIIPQNGFGSRLGTAVGTGLGQGLQDLAQMQLQQMQQRRQMQQQQSQQEQQRELMSQGLGALFPQQQAQALAGLPPDLLKEVLKQQLPQLGEGQVGSVLENIIAGGQPAPQQVAQQQTPLQELLAPQEQPPQQLPVQPEAVQPPVEAPPAAPTRLSPGAKAERELVQLEAELSRPGITASQKEKIRERTEKRHVSLRGQQEKIDEANKEYYSDLKKKAETARESGMRLDRIQELIKTGRLPSIPVTAIVEALSNGIFGFGVDISGILYSDEGAELQKLSKDFLRDAKTFFGARITENQVTQFLKTIPTLLQTDGGKERVIRNMGIFNKASNIKNDVANQIIDANGGYQPRDLERQVERIAKPQLDALAQEFKSDIKTSKAIARRKKIEADPSIPSYFVNAPEWALKIKGF